jgi:membrane fusion protein (multidrug efflux system)
LILSDNSEYPQRGRIDIIDGKFNSNTGAITLRANFPNAHGLLRSGNTGKIKLGLVHHDIFLIPQSATVQLQDKTFLFALADSNKVKKQEITLSGASGTDYVVTSGVKPGERIITDGIIGIKEGEIITPETSSKVAPIKK